MEPHFGHLTFKSFDTVPHPKENTANIANAKKMLTNLFILLHLLSSIYIPVNDQSKILKILIYQK